jgi:hypothetical protein
MRVSGHLLGQAALPPGKQFPVLCPHWIGGSVGLRAVRADLCNNRKSNLHYLVLQPCVIHILTESYRLLNASSIYELYSIIIDLMFQTLGRLRDTS